VSLQIESCAFDPPTETRRFARECPTISRTLMPRAYIEMIFSSKPKNRRWYLAIKCGSKVDS
jgi:hypothetical protein